MDIAKLVRKVVLEETPDRDDLEIVTTPSDDLRSYHINSEKVAKALGFKPKYTIEDAIRELCGAFARGELPDSFSDDSYFNVKRLQRLKAA